MSHIASPSLIYQLPLPPMALIVETIKEMEKRPVLDFDQIDSMLGSWLNCLILFLKH